MRFAIDIFGCTLDIAAMAYLYHKSFGPVKIDKRLLYVLYFVSWCMLLAMSYGTSDPMLHTLLSIDIFIPLIAYTGLWRTKIMYAISYLAAGVLAEALVKVLALSYYGDIAAQQTNFLMDYAYGVTLSRVLVWVFVLIAVSFVRVRQYRVPLTNFVPFFILPVVSMFAIHILKNIYYRLNTASDYWALVLITALLLSTNLIIFYFYAVSTEKRELEHQIKIQKLELENEKQKEKHEKEVFKMQHDAKNHYLAIDNMPDAERHVYIQKLIGAQPKPLVITGNNALDAILTSKSAKASEQQTKFMMDIVYQGITIELYDMISILANCLDNALEATNKITDPEARWINVKICPKGDKMSLVVSNAVANKVDVNNGLKTSKKDKIYHGHGVSNIKDAVLKYNGVIDINCDDKTFIVNILV